MHDFLNQKSNKFTSPVSERDYSFKQFTSRQCKDQTIKRASVKFIVATKQVKTIKQVEIDIKRVWLFIKVRVNSSIQSSERLNKRDHQASVNSRV